MDTLRVLLVLFFPLFASGQILLRKRDVTVNVGRSVYLEREDLVFVRDRRGVNCRVEVVDTDPITQRVGVIQPPIFDCDFLSKTVKYVHNGSPLLYADEIKMRAHRFTQTATVTETFYLRVRIVNASHDVIVTRGLRPVVVPKFNALSNTIDSSVIRFKNSDNHNVSCSVGFSKYHSHWPLVGQMVMGKDRHAVDAVKKDCREFLFMQLHYEHLRSPTPDVDYLPLTVELFDPSTSDEVIQENFYLPIYIKGALPNSPPKSKMSSMNMMDVDQFILTTIIPGVISAEDYETPSVQLVYNITKPFAPGHGYLVKRDNHALPITSFLQDDLENHRIAYRPPNVSFSERRMYEVEFTVFDSHFANSMPLRFHVAVHPSATNAPRVAHNMGLVLLEGQSRAITTKDLQIVDRDNLDKVKLYVKGGLHYGNIEVHGRQSIVFRPTDLMNGGVVYRHDDSDSTRDRVELRLSDGSNTVLFTFPINIIPKDDTAPHLVNNLGLQINEGGMKKISEDVLLAHDTDSLDSNIIYTIITTPASGDIIRKVRPSDSGTKVFGFRQRDLLKGQIYYRHSGKEVFRDSFHFTLQDQQEPPNESEHLLFHIIVNPMNENPPRLAPEATRLLYVAETDIAYLSKSELQYTDVESGERQLLFTITTPPYFVYNRGERDAGRLIATHNLTMMMKDGATPSAQTFTQEDITHMKIAYMPPLGDIGPESRLIRFVYTVEDSSGNRLYGQTFDIEVTPVNNKVPQFVTSKLLVEEGGILSIASSQLSANDVDTPSEKLRFMLDDMPRYGILQKAGIALRKGEDFNIADLEKKDIRYVHDGSEIVLDTFTLSVSDGLNSATKVISIDIVPIDDESPTMQNNLRPFLIVSEGGDAILTQRTLSATDADTDESSLVFLIVRQPKYGVLQLNQQPVTKFTQKDVKDGKVSFLHTSGEIGTVQIHDVITFIVSDQNFLASADMPMYDLNITITPVNNQNPTINLGNPVFVSEGEIFKITSEILSVSDPDSRTKDIDFMITLQPQWGFVENVKPSAGSERSNAGNRINSFTFRDVLDGSINYVQANHKGVEPIRDEFSFYATDGKLNSKTESIVITIVPANDEVPDLMLKDFSIPEGGSKVIDQSMVDAIDLDMPKDSLILALSQPPEHGQMVMMLHTRKGEVATDIHDFSIDELHSGMQLKYIHDGSESYHDKFAVTVSDGKHEIKRVCNVSIKLNNDERPEIIKNAGLHLDYGESALISSVVLTATDEDNGDAQLYYIIVELPKKGFLQYCPDPFASKQLCEDFQLRDNFTQYDVDQNKIRYIHTTSMGSTETDSFVFVLTDGMYKRPEETFEIRIANSKKANIALLNRGMTVREGERVAISTANLSASDESTMAEEIVFAVIRPPRLGQIEYIDRSFSPISSFTQMDIASQKVVYNHLTKNDITEDSFTFTVTNGLSEAKDGEFRITIQPLDRILPSLIMNKLLEVLQGTEQTITPVHLKVTDPDTSAMNLTYIIEKPPTYGKLYNRGVPIRNFTQDEVDLGFVTYESDRSRAGLDNFLFTVSDGRHDGFLINGTLQTQPAMSSIFIKPLVEDAPKLVTKKQPDVLEHFGGQRYGYVLTNRILRVVDSDTESSGLVYVMLQKPKHGHIENTAAKRYVRRRFTQRDLDEESLMYIIDKVTEATNDSFTFKVEDSRGNSLDNQIFEMSWSRIEFLKEDVVVCENIGTLSITLERTGAISQSAFIGINVRQMSARKDEDFTPSSAKQVQFDPGESRATWDITIKEDNLEETNEKLRLILAEPINAVIGDKKKLRLRIINAVNGLCEQYLGMVSRDMGEDQLPVEESMYIPSRTNPTRDSITYRTQHKLTPVNTFENTLFNTEPKSALATEAKTDHKPAGRKKKKKKSRKRRKNKRDKKNKKNRRNQSTPKTLRNDPMPSSAPTKVYKQKQPVKRCDMSTKDLLTFDNYKQQLLRCNGKEWQTWTSVSNNDERPRSSLCQAGWSEYEGRCYRFVNDKLPWDDAEKLCMGSYQAHVTSVHSMKHLKWLSEQAGKKSFWIGLNDKHQTGVWKFINGDPVGVTNWKNGRPRVKRMLHKKNCVVVKKRMKWRNKHCDKYSARFICELSAKGQTRAFKRPRKGPSRRHVRRNRKPRNGGGFFFG